MVWYYATRTSRHNIEHLHNTKKGREGRVGDGTDGDVDETDDVGVSDARRIRGGTQRKGRSRNVRERVASALHTLNVLLLEQMVNRLRGLRA